jgi:vacuolar-type H+-ATPase subunit I/STV1
MPSSTAFLARFIGAFTLVETVLMALLHDRAVQLIHEVLNDRALAFTWGLLALGLGLAVVSAHNLWRGGVLPVVVTLVGWLLVIRGVLLQIVTPELAQTALRSIAFEPYYYAYLLIPFGLGVYLLLAGATARGPRAEAA